MVALEELYSPRILALACAIEHLGELEEPHGEASLHSRLCGSRVRAQVRLDERGRVADFAQTVNACALGQAAAAILGARIIGLAEEELKRGRVLLERMLKEGEMPPEDDPWAELRVLVRVRELPARHAAVLLPFDAAIEAMERALSAQGEINDHGRG